MASKKIGAFWAKKTKDGMAYMSGVVDLGAVGEARVALFKNTKKEKDNHPDYNLVLSEQQKPQETAPAQQPEEKEARYDTNDSELPF